MPTERQLLDKQANLWSQMQEIRSKVDADDGGWTPELREAWDKADAELVTVIADVERTQKDKELAKRFDKIEEDTIVLGADGERADNSTEAKYRKAFDTFLRSGTQDMDQEQRQLLQANLDNSKEARALGAGVGSAGGFTVSEAFWAKVTETQKLYGGAMDGAEVITTDNGAPIPWASNDDTAMIGYQLGENVEATNEGDVEFGRLQLEAFTYVSGVQKISFQLLQDSTMDMEAFVGKKIGIRLGRIENRRFTNGNGTTQPQGYMTGLTAGRTSESATAITYNELIDLEHSVDPAYRDPARCKWKFHDLVFAHLRKLRDDSGGEGLGRPLWEPSLQVGAPSLFNGYGYVINNDMDSTVAAAKKTVAFGDWSSAFVVRKVKGASVIRFGEKFADSLQVGFLAYERIDSLVQDPSAAKYLLQTG
jgi:HK97 family phage major capsid protein